MKKLIALSPLLFAGIFVFAQTEVKKGLDACINRSKREQPAASLEVCGVSKVFSRLAGITRILQWPKKWFSISETFKKSK